MARKTKFAPWKEVNAENPTSSESRDYKIVHGLGDLEWHYNSSTHDAPKRFSFVPRPSGILGAVKGNVVDTKVETQTLYFSDLNSGVSGFVQLLYSNVMNGVYKGFQLNFKIFHADPGHEDEDIWESFKIDDHRGFEPLRFISKDVEFVFEPSKLPQDQSIGTLNVKVDMKKGSDVEDLNVNLQVELCEGYKIEPDGFNYYLDKAVREEDIPSAIAKCKKYMKHTIVPRGWCKGSINYTLRSGKQVHFELGKAPVIYLDAVQGLVPNKAASRWNFMCFHSVSYSTFCIEFTTTDEYDYTTVTTWCTTHHDKIISIGSRVNHDSVKFNSVEEDKETGWNRPTAITFPSGFQESQLRLINRYDVLSELPQIIRKIAHSIVRIRPYLYQYCQRSRFHDEPGISIVESTFIS